jgi:hypothetical protein
LYADHYVKRFHESYIEEPNTGCWLWTGLVNEKRGNYGRFFVNRKSIRAHRASWLIAHGEWPADKLVCHKCDTPQCVNPEHLFLGTVQDNSNDMKRKNRQARVLGQDHNMAKLTNNDVIEIRKRIKSGQTQRSLAKLYNVSPALICVINKNQRWKHLGG